MESSPIDQSVPEAATENVTQPVENHPASGPVPISEFAARPDFPECTLNQCVDIGGFSGTVVSIIRQSLRVKAPEGGTQSFNYHTLKKLYGPRVEIQPMPQQRDAPEESEPEPPKRNVITEPDFTAPVRAINEFTGLRDFPQAVFGQHVDVGGYSGVVVEIVNRSLRVRSTEEVTRSYNADVLRKLYPGVKREA
jgi:hypothetical protein